MTSRRSLLRAGAFTALAALIPARWAARATLPRLYSNGRDDDTEALQALFDGRPVFDIRDNVIIGGEGQHFSIRGRVLSFGAVHMGYPHQRGVGEITGCYLIFRDDNPPGYVFYDVNPVV